MRAPLPWSPSRNPQPPIIRTAPPRCTPKTEPVPIAAVIPSVVAERALQRHHRVASRSAPARTAAAPPAAPPPRARWRPASPSTAIELAEPARSRPPPRAARGGGEDVGERAVGIGPDVGRGRRAAAEHPAGGVGRPPRGSPLRPRRFPDTAPCDSLCRDDTKTIPEGKRNLPPADFRRSAIFCWTIGIVLALSTRQGESAWPISATEAQHAQAEGLQALPPAEVLARLLDGQRAAAAAVAPAIPALAAAAEAVAARRSAPAAASPTPAPAARA